MKFKYILIILFTIFSFYYADRVMELSEYNNTILTSINDYASTFDNNCIEGEINDNGIILGLNGIVVDKNKSYSNMKGIGFNKELLEYKSNKCILNKDDNLDKYILSANKYKKNVSLVIDINDYSYFKDLEITAKNENIELNYLINMKRIRADLKNVLYKTNKDDIKEFKKYFNNFYCVKTNDFDILEYCKKQGINSIKIVNYIEKDLLLNTKKILNKGIIIFIKENNQNTKELSSTIKYIKSRGYNIVSINELLS